MAKEIYKYNGKCDNPDTHDSDDQYSFIFNNDYGIDISSKKISFSIKINNLERRDIWDFGGIPYFSLYFYEQNNWASVPYVSDFSNEYILKPNNDCVMFFCQKLSAFKFTFKSGLYRVMVKISNGDRDKNNVLIFRDIMGEFFLK